MRQAQLFAGFTTPTDVTTDGVVLLTNQRTGISALRTLKLSEKQVTKSCLDFLQIRGWYAVRTPVGQMAREYGGEWLGEEGRCDWLFVHPYYNQFWVEMKATGEKPGTKQVSWMNQMKREGYIVTWTDNPDKFMDWYNEQLANGALFRQA